MNPNSKATEQPDGNKYLISNTAENIVNSVRRRLLLRSADHQSVDTNSTSTTQFDKIQIVTRTKISTHPECCHTRCKASSSWGFRVFVFISIGFPSIILCLAQDLKTIRAEIDSLKNELALKHDQLEAELNNKVFKMEESFKEFKGKHKSDKSPVFEPYEEMEAQLEDLHRIHSIFQTPLAAPVQSDSKESWLTAFEQAKNMFDKNGNIKPLKSQNTEFGILLDKPELQTFASTLRKEKKFSEALGLYERIYKRRIITLGKNHVDTLSTQSNVALCLNDLNDHKTALELNRFVYERLSETLDPTHARTLMAKHNIAVSLSRLGKNSEALHLFEDAYSKQVENLGLDHKDTLLTKGNVEITKRLI